MRSGRRALLALALAGPALLFVPAQASPPVGSEQQAVALLERAAQAGQLLSYRGTQYVGSWRGAREGAAVLDVDHAPSSGTVVSPSGDGPDGAAVAPNDLDPRLLRLLDDSYDLRVVGDSHSAGRTCAVVEARRRDGEAAGRFWLDTETGLVLRREVYDRDGRRLRSSAFVSLEVAPRGSGVVPTAPADADAGVRVDPEGIAGDWDPPTGLPGGLELYDARVNRHRGAEVLHLAYSDGLSTLSVFAQDGALDDGPGAGFVAERVDGARVWAEPGAPERLVWQGAGRVFTLVSDASPTAVRAAVQALPHDPLPDDGLRARLGRSLARLGSWLNPFD